MRKCLIEVINRMFKHSNRASNHADHENNVEKSHENEGEIYK